MGGLEATERIRANHALPKQPRYVWSIYNLFFLQFALLIYFNFSLGSLLLQQMRFQKIVHNVYEQEWYIQYFILTKKFKTFLVSFFFLNCTVFFYLIFFFFLG